MEGDIRNTDLTLAQIRDDWGSIGVTRALPNKVSPMDIDEFIELNGHFWFLERASTRAALNDGQLRAMKALSRLPNCTAVIVIGEKNTFPDIRVYRDGDLDHRWHLQAAPIEVQQMAARWLHERFTLDSGRSPREPLEAS